MGLKWEECPVMNDICPKFGLKQRLKGVNFSSAENWRHTRRRGQVVKAEVCKTFIIGSIPIAASKVEFELSLSFEEAKDEAEDTLPRLAGPGQERSR